MLPIYSILSILKYIYEIVYKVLITYKCNDKILGYDVLVHEHHNHATFMNQFIVTQNFITALTGDEYFRNWSKPRKWCTFLFALN